MKYKIFKDKCMIVLHKGDDLLSSVEEICKAENISAGCIVSAVGASGKALIGIFDESLKRYTEKEVNTLCEIVSLTGNITKKDGKPYLHFHIAMADKDNFYSGHLIKCSVGLTAEIFLDIIDTEVQRKFDDDLGINLIDI